MANYRKIGGYGLYKKKWPDGSVYYSGKLKFDLAELNDVREAELFLTLAKNDKTKGTADLWLTVQVKEDDNDGQGQLPPPKEEEDDIPF